VTNAVNTARASDRTDGAAVSAYVTSFFGKAVKVMTPGSISATVGLVDCPAMRTSHLVHSPSLNQRAESGDDASTRDGSAHNENPEPCRARIHEWHQSYAVRYFNSGYKTHVHRATRIPGPRTEWP
jgi:hypothetical protein